MSLLAATYEDVVTVLAQVEDDSSFAPTGCVGWAVRDLTYHCTMDAQRTLVAVHTPADTDPDRDAVSYWRDWGHDIGGDPESDDAGRRFCRVAGSMFGHWPQLRGLHAETVRAAARAVDEADPEVVVATQGHALRVADLASTLVVEAAVHHLDLVAHLDLPGPSGDALAEVRRVLEGLLGEPFPASMDDASVALAGTGRTAAPPGLGDRLPLFG